MFFFWSLCALPCLAQISLTFVFGPQTPEKIHSQVLASLNSGALEGFQFEFFTAESNEIPDLSSDFLVDFSYSSTIASILSQMAQRLSTVLLQPSIPVESHLYSSHVLYTHPPFSFHSQALFLLLQELNWDSFFTISSLSTQSRAVSSSLFSLLRTKNAFQEEFQVLSDDSNQSHYDRYIAIEVKETANWKLVVLNHPKGAGKALQGLKNNHIYREGCGLIIGSLGSFGTYELGTIYISEEGLEYARDEGELEVLAILKVLNRLKGNVQRNLKIMFPEGHVGGKFSVMNYKTDTLKEKVGYIANNTVSLTGNMVFPGNVTSIPTSKPIIKFNGDLGAFNYDGTRSYEGFLLLSGVFIMIDFLNKDPSFLPNFQLEMYTTDCGALFNYDHFWNCYSRHKSNLDNFYLLGPYRDQINGTIQIFRQMNIKNPIIGYLNANTDLYDKEKYPEYMNPSSSMLYAASILPNILQAMRWKNIILFGSLTRKTKEYNLFVQRAEDLRINILNDPEYRLFNDSYTSEQLEDYRHYFEHAINTRGSIIVIFADTPTEVYIVESLYDMGFRAGDVQLIFNIKIKEIIDTYAPLGLDANKVLELVDGSLSIFTAEWVGEFGEWLQPIVAQAVAPTGTGYLCFPIDSLLIGAYAIEMMIKLGQEFEDPLQLNHFIRLQRFHGCSGIVSIDGSSNSRSILSYSLLNYSNNSETNQLDERVVGNYTIGVAIPLIISKDIHWPRGQTEPMPDIKADPECGIPTVLIRELQKSKDFTLYFSGGILGISFIIILASSYKYWFHKYDILSKAVQMTFEDAAYMLGYVIEGFQIVTIAPSSSQFPLILLRYMNLLVLEVEFDIEEYWNILFIIISITIIWTICAFIVFIIGASCLPKYVKESLELVGIRLLPYISVWVYIPFVRILFSVYQCTNASGEDLTDAFFDRDCNMNCWKGSHLVCGIVVGVIAILYISMSTLSRLVWDEYSDYSFIKTNTCFCILKGPLYACLAGMSVLYKSEPFYELAFCGILGFVAISSVLARTTNYRRMNWWIRIGNIGTFWVIGTNMVGEGMLSGATAGIQIGGLAVLGTIGLVVQYKFFESMFYRKKTIRVYDLFRFGLTRKISREEINQRIKEFKEGPAKPNSKYEEAEECAPERSRRYVNHNV